MSIRSIEEKYMMPKKTPKYFVPGTAKTLQILEALAILGKPVTLQRLTEYTGLPKSSIFSILVTLELLRYIERDSDNKFNLGPKSVQFGAAALQSTNLSLIFHQYARKIVEECGETVQLAILDRSEVIYIAREDGTREVQLVSHIGRRLPAHATAIGKAMLSILPDEIIDEFYDSQNLPGLTANTIRSVDQLKTELDRIRKQGYALDNEETSEGLQCLGAPIIDKTGKAIAGISVPFLSARATPEHYNCILTALKRSAKEISERMGAYISDQPYEFSQISVQPMNFVTDETN
jgi:IclR family transcriptional regulator, KDG regulon repressor